MMKIEGGLRGLYRGFVPFILGEMLTDLRIQPKSLEVREQVAKLQIVQACLNTILWNPLQI